MNISEVKAVLERRMASVTSALEDSDNSDEIRHYYRGMKMGLESVYYELFNKDGTEQHVRHSAPKVFFKVFKDDRTEGKSCVDKLNKYLQDNPNLKIINSQMCQYTESKYGSAVLNRWDPKNTFLAEQILVQFERINTED